MILCLILIDRLEFNGFLAKEHILLHILFMMAVMIKMDQMEKNVREE